MNDAKLDVDDTSRCPVSLNCAACGVLGTHRAVAVDSPVGVMCMTLCRACLSADRVPRLGSWSEACHLVGVHCGHIGRDLDDAAENAKGG